MQKESSKNLGAILGGLCGGGAVILVALCCCVFCLYQRKKRRSKNPELEEGARTQPQKLLLRLKVPEAIGAGTDPGPPGGYQNLLGLI